MTLRKVAIDSAASSAARSTPRTEQNKRSRVIALLVPMALLAAATTADARITRIDITSVQSPTFEGRTFGSVGAYEKLRGRASGELDPSDRRNAVITDIRMPGASGIEGLRRIREIDPHVAVIMLTGFGALETAQEALRLGANDYINKPFDAREMREVIGRNVERTRLQRTGVSAAEEIKELNNRLLKELAQKELTDEETRQRCPR